MADISLLDTFGAVVDVATGAEQILYLPDGDVSFEHMGVQSDGSDSVSGDYVRVGDNSMSPAADLVAEKGKALLWAGGGSVAFRGDKVRMASDGYRKATLKAITHSAKVEVVIGRKSSHIF